MQGESESEHGDWIFSIQNAILDLFLGELLVLLLVAAAEVLKELCLMLGKKPPINNM